MINLLSDPFFGRLRTMAEFKELFRTTKLKSEI